MLSMANSGPNTNKSQFFITFRSCRHLDKKHTVFGKVVGGIEVLDKMEKIETDAKDRPKEPIIIKRIVVYVDPFREIDDTIQEERRKVRESETESKTKESNEGAPKKFRTGVGSFIDLSTLSSETQEDKSGASSSSLTNIEHKQKKTKLLSDFSSW